MRYLSLLVLLATFTACQTSESSEVTTSIATPFTVDLSEQPQWEKDGLRLYPIKATADFTKAQAGAAQYKVLSEAIQEARFRITEKKPYGRFADQSAVNTLTVQNKTADPVLLMAGEVVQGGNQDRIIAADVLVAERSIQDIPVFCVERGRWTYEGDHAIDEIDKQVFAFRGYYQLADSKVRRAVRGGDQHQVWEKVADVTNTLKGTGSTGAYANLDNGKAFVEKRTDYQRFFSDKLAQNKAIVGFVATYDGRLIGADIFGHPELLNKQFPALVNSYATDALSGTHESTYDDERLQNFATALFTEVANGGGLRAEGLFLHLAHLP